MNLIQTKAANMIYIFDETALCISLDDVNQSFYNRCSTSGPVDRTDPGVVLESSSLDINTPLIAIISLQILFGFSV